MLFQYYLLDTTGFEPNPAEYARLKDRPGPYRYLPVFLGNGAPATFHRTRYPGCSSLLMPDPKVIDLFMTIGTSAVVYPAAGLARHAQARGAFTAEINLEETPASSLVDLSILGAAEDVLPRLDQLLT